MRQPWRGRHAAEPAAPLVDDEPPPSGVVRATNGPVSRQWRSAANVLIKDAVERTASSARSIATSASALAGRLPWPARSILLTAAGWAHRGAERLRPTPLGAEQAEYLAGALRLLAAQPRRAALREVAAAYATDLARTLPAGSDELTAAERLAFALADSPDPDLSMGSILELEAAAVRLRPGPIRAQIEAEVEAERARLCSVVYWLGAWIDVDQLRIELENQSNIWSSYARGARQGG